MQLEDFRLMFEEEQEALAKLLEEENDVSIYVCIWDQTQSKNMWFVTIHQVIFFPFFRTFQLD